MKNNIQTVGKAGYIAAFVLTIIGVYACLSRYILPDGIHFWLAKILYGADYTKDALPALASKPGVEIVHRLFGAVYLVIGLMQFSASFRRKRPKLHRSLGKIFMVFSLTGAISGILFAILVPFAGLLETIPVILFGGFMGYAIYRAYIHIRRGEVMLHRAWVARSYSIGLGVSTIRVFYLVLQYALPNLDQRDIFMVSVWMGWILTLGLVEMYNQMLQTEQQQKLERRKQAVA